MRKDYHRLRKFVMGYLTGIFIFMFLFPFVIHLISLADRWRSEINAFIPQETRLYIVLPIIITGCVFSIWSNIYLVIQGNGGPAEGFGIEISPRTQNLVTKGPYAVSRNPMVFGVFCLYFSYAFYLGSPLSMLGLIVFLFFVTTKILRAEEKRLLKDFGEVYNTYRRNTSRIFPVLFRRKLN